MQIRCKYATQTGNNLQMVSKVELRRPWQLCGVVVKPHPHPKPGNVAMWILQPAPTPASFCASVKNILTSMVGDFKPGRADSRPTPLKLRFSSPLIISLVQLFLLLTQG